MEALTKEKFAKVDVRLAHVPDDGKLARIVLNTAPENQFTVKATVEVAGGKEYFSGDTSFSLENALINTVDEVLRMIEKDKRQG